MLVMHEAMIFIKLLKRQHISKILDAFILSVKKSTQNHRTFIWVDFVNETLWGETETFGFQSETVSRARRDFLSFSRDRDKTETFAIASRDCLETETSRPRLHPCDGR
jgi:hypothetical protein